MMAMTTSMMIKMVEDGDGDGYDDDPGDGEGEPPWLPRLHAASSGAIRPFLKRNRTQLEITKMMESFSHK